VPAGVPSVRGWRSLGVEGPLDFSEIGVLVSIAQPLAEAGVSILAIGTFDTDYVLVRSDDLERALATLAAAGHRVANIEAPIPTQRRQCGGLQE